MLYTYKNKYIHTNINIFKYAELHTDRIKYYNDLDIYYDTLTMSPTIHFFHHIYLHTRLTFLATFHNTTVLSHLTFYLLILYVQQKLPQLAACEIKQNGQLEEVVSLCHIKVLKIRD